MIEKLMKLIKKLLILKNNEISIKEKIEEAKKITKLKIKAINTIVTRAIIIMALITKLNLGLLLFKNKNKSLLTNFNIYKFC